MSPLVSAIIPARNEARSLPELISRLAAALRPVPGGFELIVVDDGSTDDSFAVVRSLLSAHPELRGIRLRRNFGKATALAAGLAAARGETIVTIDADLQDEPAEIAMLLDRLGHGADMVVGWKRERRDPWIKRVSSWCFNRQVSLLSGLRLHDVNCGLKAFRREVADGLALYGDRHRFLPVLAHERGFTVVEVPVTHHARRFGASNYGRFGLRRLANFLLDPLNLLLLTKYAAKPAHFFGSAGLLLLAGGGAISAYLALRWFFGYAIGSRPLFFLGILMIIVSIQLISLGFLGEMIIAGRSRGAEPYAIKERTWDDPS